MSGAAKRDASVGARLISTWRVLSPLPGGRWLFSRVLGWTVRYSGTIRSRVEVLEPGRAVLTMRDRRGVRNHLRSVHAIALANLGELSSGLAAAAAMPAGVRGIPVRISIEYRKKARGTITAHGSASFPPVTEPVRAEAHASLEDARGDVVALVVVEWALEPVR